MLQYNAYFRPTAKQLLQHKIFDEIRVPANEKKGPHKFVMNFDLNEFKYDYVNDKLHVSEADATTRFKELILDEVCKL